MSKNLNWYTMLLIYCLENGSKKIPHSKIAESLDMSINEYIYSVSFLKKTGLYSIIGKHVREINNACA